MNIYDLFVGEVLLERGYVRIHHIFRCSREFLCILQRCLMLLPKARVGALAERSPIVPCKSGSLRRSEMMLQSIVASIQPRHAYINLLVQLALERSAHTRIERQEMPQHLGPVRNCLLYIAGFSFQCFLVNLLYFSTGVLRCD